MAVNVKAGTYPALAVADPCRDVVERTRGRVHEEIGTAVAHALFTLYGDRRTAGLSLDSTCVRETLAARVIDELDDAGYVVRWGGRRA